jgi:hypothetical protein
MGSEFDYTPNSPSPDGRDRDINAGIYQKFYIVTPVEDIEFTIGAEDTEVIEVQCQVVDPAGDAMEDTFCLQVLLCSDADGLVPAALTSGTVTATTGAIQVETTAGEDLQCVTDSTGLLVLDIEDTGGSAELRYLAVKLPGGKLVVSGAIQFTA